MSGPSWPWYVAGPIAGLMVPLSLLIGGLLFGMGWALTGACPGPLWIHVGAGTEVMLIAIASALLGVMAYAFLDRKLPH